MSSRRHKRPEPCGNENCGSRRFHVGEDGYTYCDQGHQQSEVGSASLLINKCCHDRALTWRQRGTVIAEDTGELPQIGRTHRRKESDAELSARSRSRGFTGSQALEHYLLALQLVLRKQLTWLVRVAGLPEELEVRPNACPVRFCITPVDRVPDCRERLVGVTPAQSAEQDFIRV